MKYWSCPHKLPTLLYTSPQSFFYKLQWHTVFKIVVLFFTWSFPGGLVVNNLSTNEGDAGSIPGSGRYPGKGNNNPLQYSCLENPMDRGAWWSTVDAVRQSWTWLSNLVHTWILYLYSHFGNFQWIRTAFCFMVTGCVGPQFPNQVSNPCALYWNLWVLTPGLSQDVLDLSFPIRD